MNTDCTDRTITFTVRTTGYGSQTLAHLLATWLKLGEDQYRRIDMYQQRVDGVDMKDEDDDFAKELQRTEIDSYGGSD